MRMDARARQDVAFLGSEFLKLDGKILHPVLKLSRMMKKSYSTDFLQLEKVSCWVPKFSTLLNAAYRMHIENIG